jgi:phosphoribosylanthranilate isomerase
MKLKVCGLSNPIQVETCLGLDINYCGFILNFPKSHRYISFNKAKELTSINKKKNKFCRSSCEADVR